MKPKPKAITVKAVGIWSAWWRGLVCVETYSRNGKWRIRREAIKEAKEVMQLMGDNDHIVDLTITITPKGRKKPHA